ncbi:MAG: DUF3131 domain-containing protein, partial [Clostridiales bacterium]|nr:DUF3131 domain-containing protein [Clostridiales bacterium]
MDEKRLSCALGEPYMYAFAESYMCAAESADNNSLFEFAAGVSNECGFEISELLLCRAFFVLYAAIKYAEGETSEALAVFSSLKLLDFNGLYLEFAKVHKIFSREAAGVYKNCDAETVRAYDERLIELSDGDEVQCAEKLLSSADARGVHVGKLLERKSGGLGKLYFWMLAVFTACVSSLIGIKLGIGYFFLSLIPCYVLSKRAALAFFERENFPLFSLCRGKEIESTPVTVAVTTLLCGEESDGAVFDRIGDFCISNNEKNFTFAVLGDLCESKKRKEYSDVSVIKYAESRIRALNVKYGNRFALFVRRRRFAVCQGKYLGWERKRGAVIELCRYMRGNAGSFETAVGGELVLGSEYLLTLDSDTRVAPGDVKRMLGIMLHPENKPVFDKKLGRVVSGYGVLVPKIVTSLDSSSKTPFARLSGGDGGTDRYSFCGFDLYQDIFGHGIFCGKGMIHVDTFLLACDGFFPRERILSHDLLEGALLRAGVAENVKMTDSTPSGTRSHYSRLCRWIRGDLIALGYIRKYVKNERDEKIKNPMSALSRYQIADNALSASAPFFFVLLVFFASFAKAPILLLPFLYYLLPIIKTLLFLPFCGVSPYGAAKLVLSSVENLAFELIFMAKQSAVFLSSLFCVTYSLVFSGRGFLSWTTAAQSEKRGGGFFGCVWSMKESAVIGALALTLDFPYSVFGALWLAAPVISYFLGIARDEKSKISEKDFAKLKSYARDMWKYFDENVNEKTSYLPPDNVQLSPSYIVAARTSPTNIGLYLLSLLAARDFGFINTETLYARAALALNSISKMRTWNGHLYNWYDTATLSVIGTPFISTVDSGNLASALVAFTEGLDSYVCEEPRLAGVISGYEKLMCGADFSALLDRRRGLLSVGYNVQSGELSGSCYDIYMREARTTAYFAEAMGYVRDGYVFALDRTLVYGRGKVGLLSWGGTAFEYFMPSLLLPSMKNSLVAAAQKYAFDVQRRKKLKIPDTQTRVYGISESCYFEFDRDMNYQYRAFGNEKLALCPDMRTQNVISPYSSFLMMREDRHKTLKNLENMKSAGTYGKYGFYEALDMEPSRVGGGYAVIKTFMAHHIGMSIVACANECFDGVFRRRFMSNPQMRANAGVLGEKVSLGSKVQKKRKNIPDFTQAPREYAMAAEKSVITPSSLVTPVAAMLSNNKTRVIALSSGQIGAYDGRDLLFSSP